VSTRESWPRQLLYTLRNSFRNGTWGRVTVWSVPIDGALRPELYRCKDFELCFSNIGCVLQACLSGHSPVLCVPYTADSSDDKFRNDDLDWTLSPGLSDTQMPLLCLLPRTGQRTTHVLQTSLHIVTIYTAATVLRDGASFWVTFARLMSGVFFLPWVRALFIWRLAPTASLKCCVLWRQQWQWSHSGWRQVPWHPPIFKVAFMASCCLSQLLAESHCFKQMLYVWG